MTPKRKRRSHSTRAWWLLIAAVGFSAYQYATTVHRAQGQTCDYAYCAPRSLVAIPGLIGEALAYVALTRARKRLTFVY